MFRRCFANGLAANTVFRVDPDSGRIFFGQPEQSADGEWKPRTGLMYNPADETLSSKDRKIVIDADGAITANNAVMRGDSYFQGAFDCDVIKTKFVEQEVFDQFIPSASRTQAQEIIAHYHQTHDDEEYIRIRIEQIPEAFFMRCEIVYENPIGAIWETRYVYLYDEDRNRLNPNNYLDLLEYSSSDTLTEGCFAYRDYYTNRFDHYVYMKSVTFYSVSGGNVLVADVKTDPTESEIEIMEDGEVYSESGVLKIKL